MKLCSYSGDECERPRRNKKDGYCTYHRQMVSIEAYERRRELRAAEFKEKCEPLLVSDELDELKDFAIRDHEWNDRYKFENWKPRYLKQPYR